MTDQLPTQTHYEETMGQITWRGISLEDGEGFHAFMTDDVASRLHDQEGSAIFETHLRGLASTGFARDSLNEILAAEIPEERDWAVGEALAEAYLCQKHLITWPWNMARDKRNSSASLPGADLVGFEIDGDNVRLALGEVKTSADPETPPGVMNGRSGMACQLDNLANNLALISTLLKWLLPRCKGTEHEPSFNEAIGLFLCSGNKAIALFGVLIRDTPPHPLDLQSRSRSLAGKLKHPTTCQLIAIHLPCAIAELPTRVTGGAA